MIGQALSGVLCKGLLLVLQGVNYKNLFRAQAGFITEARAPLVPTYDCLSDTKL